MAELANLKLDNKPWPGEPPTVRVTRHPTQDRGSLLRCWALGFYPRDISLSWWLGEEEPALETENVETRPSGDGTYQTWSAVWVPEGEEASYSCRVQHSGLNHTLSVAWEPPSAPGLTAITIITSLATVLLVVGTVIFTKRRLQARNQESYEQAPSDCGMADPERGSTRNAQALQRCLEPQVEAGQWDRYMPGPHAPLQPLDLPGSPPTFLSEVEDP